MQNDFFDSIDPERTLNRASDADCLPFDTRVVCSRLEARVQGRFGRFA